MAIRPPHAQNLLNTLSTVKMMVELSQAKVILTNSSIAKLLRCKVRRRSMMFEQIRKKNFIFNV